MSRSDRPRERDIAVDRIACTAHGVCSVMSRGGIVLDEFGYPVPSRITLPAEQAQQLVAACPARALVLKDR